MRKASYAGAALIIVGIVTLGFVFSIMRQDDDRYRARTARAELYQQIVDATEDTLSALKDAETGQRGYLLTDDSAYLDPHKSGTTDFRQSIKRLRMLSANEATLQPDVSALSAAGDGVLSEIDAIELLYNSGSRGAALDRLRSGRAKSLMDHARAVEADLLHKEQVEFAVSRRSVDRAVGGGRTRFVVATAILFGLTLVGTILLSSEIRRGQQLGRTLERGEKQYRELAESLETQVEERTKSLLQANNALQAFSYSVSHDLRAPLRSIDGFSVMLLEDYEEKLDASGLAMLNRIRAATGRMGRLIQSLLDLARHSNAPIRRETVSLSDIARQILDDLMASSLGRNVEAVIAPDLETSADPALVRVILENLLFNAWKFTAPSKAARIEVGEKQIDNQRVFFIKDNGAGFDPKFADRLFTPFQRLHSENEFEGTGIGLATVQRVIHRHGGSIWAESKPGEGATFLFTL